MSALSAEASVEVRTGAPLRWRFGRRAALVAVAAGLLAASLFLPYWQIILYAPQYPGGLRARVYLTRVAGDADEISNLNHYIGMRPLEQAAPLERRFAVPLVLITAAALLASAFVSPRRWGLRLLLRLPALALPVGVIADLGYWLWLFGHSLDPTAPITVLPFMPPLLGRGTVMQFGTSAWFGSGMALAAAAAALALYDLVRREPKR